MPRPTGGNGNSQREPDTGNGGGLEGLPDPSIELSGTQAESGSAVDDAVSPELAMVDPLTASRAREALPEPTLFEDAVLNDIHAQSGQWADLWRIGADTGGDEAAASRQGRGRILAILAGIAVVGGGGLAVSAVIDRRHGSAAPPTAMTAAPTAHATTGVSASAPAAAPATATTPARSIPDFVWVAAAGTSRYRVEFALRNGHVVLSKETTKTRLHVKASQLTPGVYVWRVWRLDAKGSPIGPSLVEATVVVH